MNDEAKFEDITAWKVMEKSGALARKRYIES